MKVAVIGIGSNSVRMLMAKLDGTHAWKLRRDRIGTRLFAGLDEKKNLSGDAMAVSAGAVADFADIARFEGADEVRLFATSATRDAANQADFAHLLKDRSGLDVEICSGEEEAMLSFFGATGGGDCGVIDIGGGSTEYIVGRDQDVRCAFSCQMGAVRLSAMQPIRSHADIPVVKDIARNILREKLRFHPTLSLPEKWVGTGGTFTTLAAMIKKIHWTNRTYMHGTLLTREAIEQHARLLSNMTVEQRKEIPGLQPNRADIIVHGICILLASMEELGMDEITVSEYGNMDGYIKSRFHVEGEIR